MNIIYDHQIFSNQKFGGPSRYFVEIIKELIKLNNKPIIISPVDQNVYLNEISSIYKKKFLINFNKKNFISRFLNDTLSKYYFQKINYDLYHLTYYDKYFSSKKPKIITVYDLIHEKYNIEYNFQKLPKKRILDSVDHFICISHNTKKDLIDFYNIDEKKISVTHLANSLKPQPIEKNVYQKPFFLYIGSRKRYKNFKTLLKAYSSLNLIKKNYDIICFGGGELIKEELDTMKKYDIDLNSVHHFSGSDKLLINLYSNAEALIYASKYEGFGIPILEAMSCGCPVISSNTSSLPEVYGNSALTFSPESYEELMECLNKITSDENLKKKMIIDGYKREKNFSWKKCALETNNIYKKLI
tara:strand:+ start:3033 stop:4103 length:1071 start_codon:yes stop_codon:yes gene_type:complete